jgi:hypothetical protein
MYRAAQWEMPHANHPHEQLDSRTVVFPVRVPADKDATVRYTVDYRW